MGKLSKQTAQQRKRQQSDRAHRTDEAVMRRQAAKLRRLSAKKGVRMEGRHHNVVQPGPQLDDPALEARKVNDALLVVCRELQKVKPDWKIVTTALAALPVPLPPERFSEVALKASTSSQGRLQPSSFELIPSELGLGGADLEPTLVFNSKSPSSFIQYAEAIRRVTRGDLASYASDLPFTCTADRTSGMRVDTQTKYLALGLPRFYSRSWENGWWFKKWADIMALKPIRSCDNGPNVRTDDDLAPSFHLGVWAQQGNPHGVSVETRSQPADVNAAFVDWFADLRRLVIPKMNSLIATEDPEYWERMVHLYKWRVKAFPKLWGPGTPWDLGPLASVCAVRIGDTPRCHVDRADAHAAYNYILSDGKFGPIALQLPQLDSQVDFPTASLFVTRSAMLRHCTTRLEKGDRKNRLMMSLFHSVRALPKFARNGKFRQWSITDMQKVLDTLPEGFGEEELHVRAIRATQRTEGKSLTPLLTEEQLWF